METIKIRDIEARPGEKKYGFLEIAETATMVVKIPVMLVNGIDPGPKLCLTAGTHCTEYEGIEATIRIFQETNPKELNGMLVICPVINTPGFQYGTMYVNPLDGKNMGDVYPGDPNGTISEKMIYVIFNELIRQCEWHIDAHGGDSEEDLVHFAVYYTGISTKEVEEKAFEMARNYLPDFIQERRETVSGGSEAAKVGIPSIITEAGGLAAYRDADIQFHLRGIKNVMKWLGMLPKGDPPKSPRIDIPKFIVSSPESDLYVKVNHGGVFYPRLRPGDSFQKGDLMAEVKDLFGNLIEEVHAPLDGVVTLLFTKRVKIAGENAYRCWEVK